MRHLNALIASLVRPRRSPARRSTVPARQPRLVLQALEDRTVPTVFNVGDVSSLIAAINTSNTNNQSDVINLAAGTTFTFGSVQDATDGGSALPTIQTDSGLSTNTLTINGNGATFARSTAAGTPFFRFIREAVASGTFNAPNVTINNINFTGGTLDPAATGSGVIGGAVLLAGGSLTLADCIFTGNQAPTGGAVGANQVTTNPRPLNLTRCTFTQNSAVKANSGAGGAVYSISSSVLTVTDSTFTNNTAVGDGGAIRVQTSNTTTTINGSTFATNTAGDGGAILIQGPTNIDTTTVRDNTCSDGGGGVWVQGTLSVTNSTISGNRSTSSVSDGGGIFVQGDFTLRNSTVHGNRAGNGGGVAYVLGGHAASITFSTITGNSAFFGLATGGGLEVGGSGLSLGDSVIAGNTFDAGISGTGPDVGGTVNSTGFNFIGNGSGVTLSGSTAGNQVGTTAAPLNPLLGPLQGNGGPTQTRQPLAGSPLIDAGDPFFSGAPATDQRGAGYLRIIGGRADVGALELQTPTPPRVTGIQVNDGSAQRSIVTSIAVTFSVAMNLPADLASAFTLTRIVDNAPVSFTASASNATGVTVVTLTSFTGNATSFGSLADGRYKVTAAAGLLAANGLQLDGNGDGTAGDDYVFADSGATTGNQLFRLYGDADGNRIVNASDLTLFRAAYGSGDLRFDVDGNGVVNVNDLVAFRTNYGMSV
jgi:predicted outer membrane repeat protein